MLIFDSNNCDLTATMLVCFNFFKAYLDLVPVLYSSCTYTVQPNCIKLPSLYGNLVAQDLYFATHYEYSLI